jgi:putative membrane protein
MLFFVSLSERYAELIADHALHQAAGQAAWDSIVGDFTAEAARGRLADGIVKASNACGALLEKHHPKV